MPGSAVRSAALSAPVGAPEPLRALTMLSSSGVMSAGRMTRSVPPTLAVNAPCAFASASALAAAATSSGASPWRGACARSLKMRGELTIAACSGCATGTLITSMRKSAELASFSGVVATQPASSLGERTPAEPEM